MRRLLVLAVLAAAPAWAAGEALKLPSGAVATWVDAIHDAPGPEGRTVRFRFVVKDLAQRVPRVQAPDGAAAPAEIDLETGEGGADAGLVDLEELDLADAGDLADETEADVAQARGAVAPAGSLAADMAALCQNFALPRLAAPAPQPAQVIISMSEREVPFGVAKPGVAQVFEAFAVSKDRTTCIWEPF